VFGAFFEHTHTSCTACGVAVAIARRNEHECDAERRLDFQLAGLRHEIAVFEAQLAAWLESVHGRFAVWLAERSR
jgi:hypothetical protein